MKPSPDLAHSVAEDRAPDRAALPAPGTGAPAPRLVPNRFSVRDLAPQHQLLAWRERVAHVIDVLPSCEQVAHPFNASIDRYVLGGLAFTDCSSDALLLERSVARISTDGIRDYAFQVFLRGGVASVAGRYTRATGAPAGPSVLALDMNQPARMQRDAGRVLSFFVPRALVEQALPDAEAIHGRVLDASAPLTRLLIEHVAALGRNMATLGVEGADGALRDSIELLVGAFGRQAGLSGSARAAARAAIFGRARRYIEANLQQETLSPASVVHALQLPRASMYRLFEYEGGLGAYIRNRRLRGAADELLRLPSRPIIEIAYGFGFGSASDFTRAFRRAFELSPQDFRQQALEGLRAKQR